MAANVDNVAHGWVEASATTIASAAQTHTAGATLVAFIRHEGAATSITVADTAGNTWTPGTYRSHANGDLNGQFFYVENCAGNASNVVTATLGAARAWRGISVYQISGLATSSSFVDEDFGQATASTSATAGSTTVSPGIILVGPSQYSTVSTWGLSAGYTLDKNSVSTNATQTTGLGYKVISAGGSEAPQITSGSSNDQFILTLALSEPQGTIDQEGFRFRNDDGSETSATWAAAQDTNVTEPLSANLRLRMLMNATGDPAAIAYTLYHQKNGAGGYTAVPIVASSSPTLSYGAAGTIAYSTSGGTSVAPGYPSGITVNSGLVLVVGQKPSSANGGTCTTPSGWTLQYELSGANDGNTGGYSTTLGADTGNCNIYVYTKDTVSGSESGTLSVTVGTNNVCWAQIIRLQASDAATWSWSASGGKDTSAGSVSIATSAGIDVTAGDYLIGGMVIPTDVTTPSQFSSEAFSQTGTTFGTMAEISEPDSGTGNDIGGFLFYNNASSGSGSGAVTMTATAGGTTTNVRGPGFVIRARVASVSFPVYVSASSNITSGGEATTAQLTAPSGKSTSDFVTGRMWDNENGTDTIDITTDDYTEVEWCLQAQSPAVDTDYFDFRVYKDSTAADTYTVTPRWTIGSGSTPVTGSDTGAGTEGTSTQAGASGTDIGSAAESTAIASSTTVDDAGAGGESTVLQAQFSGADSASGAEGTDLAVAIAGADTGAAAEATTLAASTTQDDAATGAEATTIAVTLSDAETGSGAESTSTTAIFGGAETGAGAEGTGTQAGANGADTGAGTESTATQAGATGADTGTGAESTSTQAGLTASDTGAGAEAESVESSDGSATKTGADTGAGVESAAISGTTTAEESGACAEGADILVALSGADAGSSGEATATAAAFSTSDAGAGAEGSTLMASISGAETGACAEGLSIAGYVTGTDIGIATEGRIIVPFGGTAIISALRTYAVRGENRTYAVPEESRAYAIREENRTLRALQ